MAVVIVLEDGWDGHYVLSNACHLAGHQVLAVPSPSYLASTLRATPADALIVDAELPGLSLPGIRAAAAEAGLPVLATGYGPWMPGIGTDTFVQKPSSPAALVEALREMLDASSPVSRAAA